MGSQVLVVAPHHDDECIGCGGLLSKLKRHGWSLFIVTVFDPIEGRNSPEGQQRLMEASASASILGAQRIGDMHMDCRQDSDEWNITWKLVRDIRLVQPDLLLIPHAQERDPEHQATHRASLEALWLSESSFRDEYGPPAPPISLVLGYEVWTPCSRPQITIDISQEIDTKLKAINCYASQITQMDLARAAQGLAMYRGTMMGNTPWAESYTVERMREGIWFSWLPQ